MNHAQQPACTKGLSGRNGRDTTTNADASDGCQLKPKRYFPKVPAKAGRKTLPPTIKDSHGYLMATRTTNMTGMMADARWV